MATAAARLSVNLTHCRDMAGVIDTLGSSTAGAASPSGWIRAWGYDESLLEERRHPTRADLDRASAARPLVVHHRTGHAAVLNSVALREVGAEDHPDGLLFDRHDLLARVPHLEPDELAAAAGSVSRDWAAAGIAAFVDATHTNGAEELELLARWCHDGVVAQEVTAMVAPDQVAQVPAFGRRLGRVRVGHVKLMPAAMAGDAGPELRRRVDEAHAAGYPVAVHVVGIDVLEDAIEALGSSAPPAGTQDRIEHNSLSLPEQVPRLAATGAAVVVNPSFLLHRRLKYGRELSEVEQGWLIRMRSLVEAGITLRAGSDSPVAPALPAEMVAAATAHPFSPEESLDASAAAGLLGPFDQCDGGV